MRKKAAVGSGNQGTIEPHALAIATQQLMLPLLVASDALRKGMFAFVQQMGMLALQELFAAEAAMIAGPKGKRLPARTHHHWGTAKTTLPFAGRHVAGDRPRVRRKGGGEVELASVDELRRADPLSERVAEQIVLGVSTRGYERSLQPLDEEIDTRGASKSAASRALIESTTTKLAAFVERRLDDVELVAMFIDGIEVAKHTVVIALGVTIDGTKVPLGLWCGSTENAVVATALVQSLVERGLRVDDAILFVIDGGKGIRKALRDVFGDRAIVQRCQVHKLRNVKDHLPESRRAYVARQMRDAYKSASASTAKRRLLQLASWLESNGEDSAAASLREGLDETLTVLRLNLPKTLCRTFSTTNAIENMNGTLRRISRNVKRWKGDSMIRRWFALGIAEAQRGFRRVKGHHQIGALIDVMRSKTPTVTTEKRVA
ncbi:MAG: IS256 family transposase [Deltaproteobacteria bacterium]|nr:IS256 family transposase [Deltaproteobacteria bacterium]